VTPLSGHDRTTLLAVARGAVLSRLGLAPFPALPEIGPLAEPRGAFVTLHVAGELRGCMGTFRPVGSLAATVAKMAIAAASEDPRFRPVAAPAAGLHVAVSALGTPWPLADRRAVEVGRHGLVVKRGWQRGALLPRVAVEHGWSGEEFLRHTCLKAGLPPHSWEEVGCEVDAFLADEFGEEPAP
jgi:hypothetical protein